MLRLSNLNIGYNDSAPVVSSIDAELSDGCFCCLLGRNGTGKSTLLRTIAGLQHPLTGTIERPDSIGIVLTGIPNLLNTKVREMVAYGRLAHTGIWGRLHDEDYAMADEAIRLVGIQDIADRLPFGGDCMTRIMRWLTRPSVWWVSRISPTDCSVRSVMAKNRRP